MSGDGTIVDSEKSKVLSICMIARDDDYMLDFRYRITTTINYIARNLKRLRRLDDVEILVTDWGSDFPMAQSLPLTPEAGRICRFIYVFPSVVCAVQNGVKNFHTTIAMNAALRRARGEFVMVSAADTLIPQHSLDAILGLLDGRLHMPMAVDHTYFMCSRYQVPWQFVQREPSLDEWDRYLLLHAGEFERGETAIFSVSAGAGALMMHRSLWHELRGFDERLGGYGQSDVELGLRVTQCCPWVELSSIGVSLFHMEHPPFGRRASIVKQNANPHIRNPVFPINDERWGLGNYELEIQIPQNICAPEESVESIALPLKAEPQKMESSNQSRQEVLAELKSDDVRDHVRRIIELSLMHPMWWNIDSWNIDYLFFLSWYSRYHYPRRYLEIGVRQGCGAAIVAASCPSVEIYGIDRWEGVLDGHIPASEAFLRIRVAHRGYARFINGDISTAVPRLRESFVGSFFLDLVFIRGDLLGTNVGQQVSDLVPHLSAGGALVFSCKSADRFASVWDEVQRQSPQFTYLRCKNHSTGLILAASLQNDDRKSTVEENCLFDTRWIWLSRVKCWSLRLYRGLLQPSRYLEYAARVGRWVRRKIQLSSRGMLLVRLFCYVIGSCPIRLDPRDLL
jgi:predicted O-methyltransferase YrrM